MVQEQPNSDLSAAAGPVVLSNTRRAAGTMMEPLHLSNVADAQHAINVLRHAGFLHRESIVKPLAEDGQLGHYTRAAIIAFQQAVYLPATGRLDTSTRGMLAGAMASYGIAANADMPPDTVGGAPVVNVGTVIEVQAALNRLTYGSLAEDGVLGEATRQAILDFQRAYLLPATGVIDRPTRTSIAQALISIGVPAFAPPLPAVLTGALSAAPSPQVADRSAEIRQQALFALHELREIGVTAVADSLRHLLSDPSVANLRQIVTFLKMPSTGAFANQVSALWAPVLDGYLRQPDPDGALRAAIPAQMTPLLSQLDAVLGAVNGLAATATVDNLNATVAMLSQPQAGPLGRKIAQPLQALLATITAPTGAATT